MRELDARGHDEGLEAGERVARVVRVDRRQRALVARVHRLEHVQGLGAADLADDDPVGAHAQGVPDELADADLALSFDVRRPRLERDHVLLLELELGRILDRDDALVTGDERRHRVERRRLTGTGTARDQDVQLALHAGGEELCRLRRDRPERDQVVHRVGVSRELPDRQRRALERQRWDDRVHAGAVRQARVDHRRGLVHAPADLRHDLVDDAQQVRVVGERSLRPLDLAQPLDIDPVIGVDHDLGHGVVSQEVLERSVAQDVVGDLPDDLASLLTRERRSIQHELLRDRARDALVQVAGCFPLEELCTQRGDAGVMDAGLQLCVRILRCGVRRGLPRLSTAEQLRGRRGARAPVGGLEAVVEAHGLRPRKRWE